MSQANRTLVGLAAGLALVLVVHRSPGLTIFVSLLEPLGMLWVNAIRMTVLPLVVCLVIFFLGHLSPVLVQASQQLKGGALALVGFLARLIDMILPSLEFFSSSPVVIRESALDASAFASYVGSVFGYAGMYTAIVLLFGLILFEDRDLA